MCNLLFRILPVACFCVCNTSNAQTKQFSLQDVIQLTEKNYPLIKAKAAYQSAAEYSVKEVKREYLPSLKLHEQLDYATANAVNGSYFPYGIVVPTSGGIGPANIYTPVFGSISLGMVEWAPYSFGQETAKRDIAKAALEEARNDALNETLVATSRSAEAYLTIVAASRLLDLQNENLHRTENILQITLASTRNGLKAGADSSYALAEVSRARLAANQAEKDLLDLKAVLSELAGLNDSYFQVDSAYNSTVPVKLNEQSADVSVHPFAKYDAARIKLGEAREKSISSGYFPKLSVLAGAWGRGSGISNSGLANRTEDFSGADLSRYNYALGLAMTFNIMDYPRMRAAYTAEKYNTEGLSHEYDAEINELKTRKQMSGNLLELSLKQYREVPIQLQAANEAYIQTKARYEAGLSNLTDLVQALYNLNRAEADKAIATNAVWKALLYKATTDGDMNEFIQYLK